MNADGTTIHEDVKTSSKGTETSYRSETLPTGDKTVTEQVKQPSGDFSKTTTSTTVKTDDAGNIISTSVNINVEVKKGNTTTKSSFTVISSKPKANKNALGAAAKLAAKGKMVSDFAARTSVSEQNKLAGSLDDIVSNQRREGRMGGHGKEGHDLCIRVEEAVQEAEETDREVRSAEGSEGQET